MALPALLMCAGAAAAQGVKLAGGSLGFSEQDAKGQQVRRIAVALTDEPGKSCLGGDWKKVRVIADDADRTAEPVYRQQDGKLESCWSTRCATPTIPTSVRCASTVSAARTCNTAGAAGQWGR